MTRSNAPRGAGGVSLIAFRIPVGFARCYGCERWQVAEETRGLPPPEQHGPCGRDSTDHHAGDGCIYWYPSSAWAEGS